MNYQEILCNQTATLVEELIESLKKCTDPTEREQLSSQLLNALEELEDLMELTQPLF